MFNNSKVEIILKKLIRILLMKFNKMVYDNTLRNSLITYVEIHHHLIQIKARTMIRTIDSKF